MNTLTRGIFLRAAGVLLALESDSTRLVSLFIDATVIHNITHHGNRPEALAELRGHEEKQFDALSGFLSALAGTKEKNQNLLDRTMVLCGTPMGSANSHSNVNLPVLLAGGGFKHGQRLGIETGQFSTGKGTLRGLELA